MYKPSGIMEEGENKHVDISGEDLDLDGKEGVFIGGEEALPSPLSSSSPSSHPNGIGVEADRSGETSVSLMDEGFEEEGFEPVSLNDQEDESGGLGDREDSGASLASKSFLSPPDVVEKAEDLAGGRVADNLESSKDHDSLNAGDMNNHSASTSFDGYTGSGVSHVEPPQKIRTKSSESTVSPELLHLIDSAIMGKPESLDKLKNIVTGVNAFGDEDNDSVSFLVIDSLLATMGGVESFGDDDGNNPPSVMLNSRAAIVAGELIPWLPCAGDRIGLMSPRTRMVRGLLAILQACTRNRAMCSTAGLLGVLIRSAERIFVPNDLPVKQSDWDGTPLCYCIQYLAGHSLNVVDLHRWLEVITRTLTTVWAPRLMLALEKAVGGKESRGPACTFEFDGESSGLLGPGESRWPFTNGYAFATWIYIESFADTINTATAAAAIAAAAAATAGKASPMSAAAAASALAGEGTAHMPRLFSFLSADNQGLEAYFHAQFLVVECGTGKGKKASLHFTHAFKPQCWYFIGLEHTCKQGLLGKSESELRLYIDGSLYETRPFEFPRISKPLAFCCIGTNPPPTMAGLQRRRRQCPLFAEMGPVYIFKEPIGPDKMARLASRGGDVLPSFGSGGLPWLAMSDYIQNIAEESLQLDVELAGLLHLLYHPRLLSGRYCPDASPSGAAGALRRPAEVLGQVHVASRIRSVDALWALAYGGPMSLLPLTVTTVKNDSLEPEPGNLTLSLATAALAAPVFRIIAMAMQHPGNNEEICRGRGPEVLSRILNYLLQTLSSADAKHHDGVNDEELVAAVVSLCEAQKHNHALKVQLFSTLLLDLKVWSLCNYGLQKKLLSSLADMVFTQSAVMRDANAIQMLLDACRRCYWTIREKDSVNTFSLNEETRPIGEVNALIDELLVVVELLMVAAPPSLAADDIHCLLCFLVDCPQPNQVARVLHLIYRLVVQPKASRAQNFANAFISCGGVETLLVLLQREAKTGDQVIIESPFDEDKDSSVHKSHVAHESEASESCDSRNAYLLEEKKQLSLGEQGAESLSSNEREDLETLDNIGDDGALPAGKSVERMTSVPENFFAKNVGGINLSISADNARNNAYNYDKIDGVVVGIIKLLGTLVASGYVKFNSNVQLPVVAGSAGLPDTGGSMFDDKVSLLLFALQKAFQASPRRLMTTNVYTTLLAASINATSTEDGLNLYDSGHRFEHLELLLVLLRSLPYASIALQSQVLQDLLFLACSHPDNRNCLIQMEEWPEWLLEVLISNYERAPAKGLNTSSFGDLEDLIHNFLIIMLEHSMRQKDGWKDIEATIHCAEWLSMVGGSSSGDQRMRREESLPIFKRRLLGSLLDFSARELQVQTEVIAAAAAGVAAECSSATNAKAEAESAAQLSVALVENAIVILMLVEDHLRLQSKLFCARHTSSSNLSSLSAANRSNSLTTDAGELKDALGDRKSWSGNTGGLPLDILTSMADENGQISATVMERLTAAAAAEPYESVSCAFVSYGSCAKDLAEGWKFRSRLWYGVGEPSKAAAFSGGGSGWESWNSALEKDADGCWIELPLIKKSVTMLQALLLDESGLGGGLGIGGGSGTGMGGMAALFQLLDSDQPFLCMLRMVLVSMREEDNGDEGMLMRNSNFDDASSDKLHRHDGNVTLDINARGSTRKPRSALLWSVLSPVLNMPISESKRQRVLVASCVLYSEMWHAVGKDRNPLRKQYLEAIVPPFVAILRRWRPLLAGIHELATADGLNPLVADDRALAADALPIEGALAMVSPAWAAAFASPPAAMALAMIAAGASGGDAPSRASSTHLKRDVSMLERKSAKLQTFSSFQKPPEIPSRALGLPKDKASAKAAALAAARDLERNAKIGSGRGLSAVAMATSAQRRNASDMERVTRWTLTESMGTAWMECLQPVDTKSVYSKDFNALSYKFIAVLVASLALARNIQRSEIDRRTQVDMLARHRQATGSRAWRKLIHYLTEMKCLFGPFRDHLCNPERVFWKLDFMESSSRMKLCLRRNYRGSAHIGAAANYEDADAAQHDQQREITVSNASVLAAEAISADALNEDDENVDVNIRASIDFDGEQHEESHSRHSVGAESQKQVPSNSHDGPTTSGKDLSEDTSAVAPGYVPSERDERIMLELPCSMVRPLRVVRGTFQITTKRINFIAENSEANSSGTELDHCSEVRDQEKNRCWLMSSLHQIYSRRYLLRRSALELFMLDRLNYFFDFGTSEGRRNAYRAIVHARPPHLNNIYLATQRPDQLLERTQLMERWARREISNFEYLMQLNTLAGRSYNDITQYPIFPWILSDYSSQQLDLSNPASYRDLSKPVGALNPERLKKFQERYSSFDDPVIPKFHYGSHYSSAGTVLYYLVRLEPFTTLAIQLQGGKFDHADRMFADIAATWEGVLEEMSDVKELVPELFYLPEMLTNENAIDFGTTQLGQKLDLVKLPPWAENPVEFIRKHRMALESEYVSAHLHEWIDLIFGYKQRGKEAIAANNVFFYITYEGTVDIDKITDPVQQRATQDQIAYFGQTPSQLLTVPHIKRLPLAEVLQLQTIFRNPKELKPYAVPMPERLNLPASAMHASSDSVIIVDINAPAACVAQHKWQPNTPDGQGAPFLFHHGKATTSSSGGGLMRMFKAPAGAVSEDWRFPQALAYPISGIRSSAIVAITSNKEIITGGHIDNSIKMISTDGAKTLETAIGHCAPVTCLGLSSDSNYLVTGSQDTTVLLWRIHSISTNNSEPSTSSSTHTSNSSNTSTSALTEKNRKRRIEGPIHVMRGHLAEIVSCCVSSELGVVVSCSQSPDILLHSIRRGRLLKRLAGVQAHSVCLSSDGIIMAWNQTLRMLCTFTLNGIIVARVQLPWSGSISCMEISFDGQTALVGLNCAEEGSLDSSRSWNSKQQGIESLSTELDLEQEDWGLDIKSPSICFLDLYTLKVLHRLNLQAGQDITAMALNKDNTNLLVSTMDRQLMVFTDPALSVKVVDQMLKLGWEGDGLSPLMK